MKHIEQVYLEGADKASRFLQIKVSESEVSDDDHDCLDDLKPDKDFAYPECRASNLLRPDSDGHILTGHFTDELLPLCDPVQVSIRLDTSKETILMMLEKVTAWLKEGRSELIGYDL